MGDTLELKSEELLQFKQMAAQIKRNTDATQKQIRKIRGSIDWDIRCEEQIDGELGAIASGLSDQVQKMEQMEAVFMQAAGKTDEVSNILTRLVNNILSAVITPITATVGGFFAGLINIINSPVQEASTTGAQNANHTVTVSSQVVDYSLDDAKRELREIESRMQKPDDSFRWNLLDKNGSTSVSCYGFSNYKLCKRGIMKEQNGGFVELKQPEIGVDIYNQWGHDENSYAKTSTEYIKYLLKEKNNGNPLYNIYIEGRTAGKSATHTILIDKAYLDGDGNMRLIFSDNADASKGVFNVASNSDGVKTANYLFETTDMSEGEFISGYRNADGKFSWGLNYKDKPVKIVCYGRNFGG